MASRSRCVGARESAIRRRNRQRKLQIVSVCPVEWNCDTYLDHYTVYHVTSRFAGKVTIRRMRYNEFDAMLRKIEASTRDLEEDSEEESDTNENSARKVASEALQNMPTTHYLPWIGKYFDSEDTIKDRANGMCITLRCLLSHPVTSNLLDSELKNLELKS